MGKVVITFDVLTCAPEGPQKEFPRQLRGQIEAILNELNRVGVVADEVAGSAAQGAPVGYLPRVKAGGDSGLPTVAEPYQISWGEIGKVFDDVGAAAATGWQLPDGADYGSSLDARIPFFWFENTSGQAMRIFAGDDEDIQADGSDAGATIDLTSSNAKLMLGLVDDRWRAYVLVGEWEIDAS